MFAIAEGIVAADGAEAVTIRRVAREIGYTAPIVYQHYTDKAALLDAVMLDAYERLAEQMRQARSGDRTQGPREVLHAYLDFAAANPLTFLFMHGLSGVDISPARRLEAARVAVVVTLDSLQQRLPGRGDASAEEFGAQAEVLWAVATGLALTASVQADGFDRVHALADLALDPLLAVWEDHGEPS